MGQDDYKPRKHDHLVEPVFTGLGVGREADSADETVLFEERVEITLIEKASAGQPRRRAYRWASARSRFWRRLSELLRGG